MESSLTLGKLSSIELSANFSVQPPPRTIDFDVGALLLSETDMISFRGYYTQGISYPGDTTYNADPEFSV